MSAEKLKLKDQKLNKMMIQAQNGNQVVYKSLFKEVSFILTNYLRRRVNNPNLIEDILQEILISLHKARRTYDPTRPFLPWLYAIAEFRLIDFLRKYSKTCLREGGEIMTEPTYESTHQQNGLDLSDEMTGAFEKLSPTQRKVIEHLKFNNISVKDTAKEFQMSESAVKVTAHRGYKILREILRGTRP